MEWLNCLAELVFKNNLVIFRFSPEEWGSIAYTWRSWDGPSSFTVARAHSLVNAFSVPTVGLLFGEGPTGTETSIGLVESRRAASTLESMVKVTGLYSITPDTEQDLVQLVTKRGFKTRFRRRLKLKDSLVTVGPELSAHLIERLAANSENHEAMRKVFLSLDAPNSYSNIAALQQDALNLSLKVCGLSSTVRAEYVETRNDRETGLARVDAYKRRIGEPYTKIYEDDAIQLDASEVPGFQFCGRDLTGRAIFRRGSDKLEVITANRKDLEKSLGVDLIYLNANQRNVVMVQYKMLEPHRNGRKTDWIYRPDRQLQREMERMKLFGHMNSPDALEYRINPQVFYLRFVRRDAELGKSTATVPIDHFQVLREDPVCKGPRGAFRITYNALDGRYLRQEAFVGLLSSGYIGAHARTTADLEALISEKLDGNKAIVGAHQTKW